MLTIEEVGRLGDGIARLDAERVFVPFTLAGEEVRARVAGTRGELIDVVRAAPARTVPFCPHFGSCGGCALQHMSSEAYAAWKRDLVVGALADQGIATTVAPLVDAHGRGRRRVTFHTAIARGAPIAGFTAARSHRIDDLDACPILVPELAASPNVARALAAALGGSGKFDVQLTVTDSGIDVHVSGTATLGLGTRQALAGIAGSHLLARLTVADETIVTRQKPTIRIDKAAVTPPPGAFLQATEAGERTLATLVVEHLGGAHHVADLFAGIGAFAFRLAATASVDALDSDAAAIAALDAAARGTPGLRPVRAAVRDLHRRPLTSRELEGCDAVVFDPPRAGAQAQARALASSRIDRVAAVSCNPITFARDAAILLAGGFRLEAVHPVDQFKWSPHVELVGLFRRD